MSTGPDAYPEEWTPADIHRHEFETVLLEHLDELESVGASPPTPPDHLTVPAQQKEMKMASYLPTTEQSFPTASELFGPILSAAVGFVQQLRGVEREIELATARWENERIERATAEFFHGTIILERDEYGPTVWLSDGDEAPASGSARHEPLDVRLFDREVNWAEPLEQARTSWLAIADELNWR